MNVQLTKDFASSEFDCHDGTPVPAECMAALKELAHELQTLRDFFGIPLIVNSGYRTEKYNKRVGGVADSQHLTGRAADICSRHISPKQIYNAILQLIHEGKMRDGGLGLYHSWVHYDIGDPGRRWNYS